MKFNVKSLLKDKIVLYVVLFFAITNFFGYILLKNYDAVMFMVLVGLITSYFSKNMIVILLSSIILTTFLTTTSTIKEGLVEGKASDEADSSAGSVEGTTTTASPTKNDKNKSSDKEEEEDRAAVSRDKKQLKIDEATLNKLLKTKGNLDPVEAMAKLEPLMASAEGMIGMLDKTNAIGRMEGLLTRMNDMQK